MPQLPEQLSCDRCDRAGSVGDLAGGWSVSTDPRPTGFTGPADGDLRVLCADCARQHIRDVEARLDP